MDEFVLAPYLAMVLLEEKGELNKLLSNPLKLEFQEEVYLKNSRVLRIGVFVLKIYSFVIHRNINSIIVFRIIYLF